MNRRISVVWLASVLFLSSAWGVTAAETGVLPYKAIASVYDALAGVKTKDRILFSLRVVSKTGTNLPAPIELRVRSKTGDIPLTLAANGELLDFPLRPELRAENPPVASNQPKGSLSLRAELGIKYSGNLTESVEWYREALRQFNAAVKASAAAVSSAAPKLKTVVFVFASPLTGTVTLRGTNSQKLLLADPKGKVRLTLQKDSDFKDVQLLFTQPPVEISAE